ncbi:hypoxanthine phosphoribosyltransferase [Exiguobacterium acetylicum]|uniref:hypoxanthine phosphoribosyltransferase n=1 Tax=Exiguobacterium acetylicum TaxID=41170 RepID=UPI001EE2DB62|nr:hypoxanthine phosphoribosyltransferase [Exiguobacterium acetylicum]UKS56146.1 hypoxanthine phosphoribosyltransferase [Exiguobacterium acetylicum]
MTLMNDMEKVLISEEEIQNKVGELAGELTADYHDRFPLLVCVLKGAMPFMSDLVKKMDMHLEMDFMDVSTYHGGTTSTGEVKIEKDLNTSVEGRDILIVEDIIDSGLTLGYLVDLFKYRKAKSVKIVTLLDKPTGRKNDLQADYSGFVIPHEFVVGYGLDYEEKYRNLPYVGVLKPAVYGG